MRKIVLTSVEHRKCGRCKTHQPFDSGEQVEIEERYKPIIGKDKVKTYTSWWCVNCLQLMKDIEQGVPRVTDDYPFRYD